LASLSLSSTFDDFLSSSCGENVSFLSVLDSKISSSTFTFDSAPIDDFSDCFVSGSLTFWSFSSEESFSSFFTSGVSVILEEASSICVSFLASLSLSSTFDDFLSSSCGENVSFLSVLDSKISFSSFTFDSAPIDDFSDCFVSGSLTFSSFSSKESFSSCFTSRVSVILDEASSICVSFLASLSLSSTCDDFSSSFCGESVSFLSVLDFTISSSTFTFDSAPIDDFSDCFVSISLSSEEAFSSCFTSGVSVILGEVSSICVSPWASSILLNDSSASFFV